MKIISSELHDVLKKEYPAMVAHPISDHNYKVAAGWLIESCGWKGVRKGNVGCYEKQALVIVSYGIESGSEVFAFSEEILQSVKEKFGINE